MGRYPLAAGLAAATLAVVAAGAVEPARAASSDAGRALAVSVPSDPVPASPGGVAKARIRIVNPNPKPIDVTVESRSLLLGDNGKVSMGAGADPEWSGRVHLPSGVVRLPAEGWRDVDVAVAVPHGLRPDLYFIGFLVTPVAASGGAVKVINQIGSFVTLDVPGPRMRKLAAHLSMPWFVLGRTAHGTLDVSNTGDAAVRFWGESDTSSWPRPAVAQDRLETYLLPIHRARVLTVVADPHGPIGILRVTTRIVYPGLTESSTKEITFTSRTIVVSPWVPAALGGRVVFLLAAWRVRRRRRLGRLAFENA